MCEPQSRRIAVSGDIRRPSLAGSGVTRPNSSRYSEKEASEVIDFFLLLLAASREAPRGVATILAGLKQTYPDARRVSQMRFAPEPRLVVRSCLEPKARRLELLHLGVEVFELEVDDDGLIGCHVRHALKGKRGSTDGTLESRVVRRIADDLAQAKPAIKRD